jgi:hypothetical protein
MGEVSLNTLGSMSEYDTYVLQGNSTQNSLAIQWPFSRRRVPLQENSWQDFFAVLAKIYQRCAAFARLSCQALKVLTAQQSTCGFVNTTLTEFINLSQS